MQHSRVCIFWLTRCLIRPSGERSHGMSLALMTLGSVAYCSRNFSDSTIASARKLLVLAPDSAAGLSSNSGIFGLRALDFGRRMEFRHAGRKLVGRPLHH